MNDIQNVEVVENKKFSFSQWFKKVFFIVGGTISFLSAFGALGGVLFQRGIFRAVGLQNIEINTTIYDLIYYGYYSSMLMFIQIYKALNFDAITNEMLFPSIMVSIFSVFFLYLIKNKENIPSFINDNRFFQWSGWKYRKFLLYPVVAIITFILPSIFRAGVMFLMLLPFAVIAMIGGAGEKSGERYMVDLMKESPKCTTYEELIKDLDKYGDVIMSCGTYTVGERTFQGEIVQNNKDGYLILQASSVVYASKDGKHCFYNYFVTKDSVKSRSHEKVDENKPIFKVDKNLEKNCKKVVG